MNLKFVLWKFGTIVLLSLLLIAGAVTVGGRSVPASTTEATDKVVYLTFDDGPSPVTAEILDILKEHGVTATFFVTAQRDDMLPLIERELAEGHYVAVHTFSHDFGDIYASPERFWADQDKMRNYLFLHYAHITNDFRFPGGSSNTIASRSVIREIIAQAAEKGYRYHDWNIDTSDAVGSRSGQAIMRNLFKGLEELGDKPAVILMHDIPSSNTRLVLSEIITELKNMGYRFDTVNNMQIPVAHNLK